MLAAAGTGLVDFLASRKLCADSLFGNVGLDPQVLETPTATIGLDQYCAVMEQAARRSRDPNFGLDYGQQFTPEMLGLIGYIALSSPTVLDAAANLARYFGYHQQQTITTLDRHERLYHLTYRIDSQRIADRSQDALITLGMFCNVFRSAAGTHWAPEAVHVEHGASENVGDIERAFGAPVLFNQPTNALVFRGEAAEGVMPHADPRLLQLLCANLTGLGLRNTPPSLIDRIRTTIRDNLAVRPVDLPMVSEVLSIPAWTLRRRLSEENTSFSDLVDQVRRDMAEDYLVNTDLQIGQLSERLGYAEISAFTRAFKRWHDVSPAQYRKGRAERLAAGR
ncbi:AraC family transcriptional regulator [Rhizobium sp. SG2393]|uniref:AraC-like transcriptional regulator QhpR n=1 Tax=Rhizobium sp. SG2393 TaxID=3276279 RepID=UPI00366E6A6C